MGREAELFSLNPTIIWEPCIRENCSVEGMDVYSGKIVVPSNYDDPCKKVFPLYVEQYTKPQSDPIAHVILLAGGPGGYGSGEEDDAARLVNEYDGKVAAYLIDHRGLGGSGEFTTVGNLFTISTEDLSEIFEKGEFDIKDLIMTNAALDVAMLGIAIKKDVLSEVRVVLHGFSYGAQWAHHVVQLTPDLFTSAFLGGLPKINGTDYSTTLIGLGEVCAKDEFCRSKMGGNVYANMDLAVRNLSNANYNECTMLFHKQIGKDTNNASSKQTSRILRLFRGLLDDSIAGLEEDENFRSAQLLLPFLMATEKCIDAEKYRYEVLMPMIESVQQHSWGDCDYNSAVNSIIYFDTNYRDFSDGKPRLPADHTYLHLDVYYSKLYYNGWKHLKQFLEGRNLSHEHPARTSTTEMYIMASRADVCTSYLPAWSLFNSITAPTKRWLLFDNREHDGYWGECHDMLEKEAIFGTVSGFDYEKCVRRDDAEHKLDWTFANMGEYARMWDCVPDATDLEMVINDVPVFLERMGVEGDYVGPVTTSHTFGVIIPDANFGNFERTAEHYHPNALGVASNGECWINIGNDFEHANVVKLSLVVLLKMLLRTLGMI